MKKQQKKIKNDKLYCSYRKWSKQDSLLPEGVLIGSDQTQEWILPWWWHHYERTNCYPVTFVDFGMSDEAKAWCRKRGNLLRLPVADIFVADKQEINASHILAWEDANGKEFWIKRNGWFKKPLACLLTPYQKTLWIDLDCEIRGLLEPLFTYADHPSGIALAHEIHDPAGGYNSGVIIFKQGIPLIETWADLSMDVNHLFAGDQDILTHIIFDQKIEIAELPLVYNWSRRRGDHREALIFHWHGQHGKTVIANQLATLC